MQMLGQMQTSHVIGDASFSIHPSCLQAGKDYTIGPHLAQLPCLAEAATPVCAVLQKCTFAASVVLLLAGCQGLQD